MGWLKAAMNPCPSIELLVCFFRFIHAMSVTFASCKKSWRHLRFRDFCLLCWLNQGNNYDNLLPGKYSSKILSTVPCGLAAIRPYLH